MGAAVIDLYCERTGPGLWAEPVNALTNLAYVAAAWALWHSARSSRTVGPGARLLIGLLVAIGTGSMLFHTFATSWARILDEVPILLFQLSFLWLYGRQIMRIAAVSASGFLDRIPRGRVCRQAIPAPAQRFAAVCAGVSRGMRARALSLPHAAA